jgi:hypothetical protein
MIKAPKKAEVLYFLGFRSCRSIYSLLDVEVLNPVGSFNSRVSQTTSGGIMFARLLQIRRPAAKVLDLVRGRGIVQKSHAEGKTTWFNKNKIA